MRDLPHPPLIEEAPPSEAQNVPEGTSSEPTKTTKSVVKVSPKKRSTRIDAPVDDLWPLLPSGDTDLYEASLPRGSLQTLLTALLVIAAVIGIAAFLVVQYQAANATETPTAQPVALANTATATRSDGATVFAPPPTNTRVIILPTLNLPTITLPPPTPTVSPTQGPCMQKAVQNDTVFGMASRCGHRDLAIVDEILRRNNMKGAGELQIGQELEIPWPTPTGGPVAGMPAELGGSSGGSDLGLEPTLLPSLRWYTVKKGDTALSIVFELNITMRILRDLNPEVKFEGCDYGQVGGGPACLVPLYENQRMRVPAPTPTATIPPTASGSETPTPTATPTFNAPFSQSPSENMLFERYELPTLRWIASGQLGPNDVYLITVLDRTANKTYYATTRELSFQMPGDWQSNDGKRHVFEWKVTVALLKEGSTAIPSGASTETRTFTWQSR